jgi:hypothetical protein
VGHRRCWYCGVPGRELTKEHVLSEKHFGGRLVAPKTVCEECNRLAGQIEVMVAEHPFVAEAVAEFISGRGGKGYPQSRAVLPDGAQAQVERRPGGTEIVHLQPRRIRTDPDGIDVWEVAAGQETEFVERRRKRGEVVRTVGRPLGRGGRMELHYGIGGRNFAAWPRFVAKTALATLSFVIADDWLDSDGALALQDVFHERRRPGSPAYSLPLYPWEQDRTNPPWSSLSRGEHVLGLWRDIETGEWRFGLTLFGYLVAEADIRDTECPSDEPTWVVPCDGSRPERLSRSGFDSWLAERDAQGTGGG